MLDTQSHSVPVIKKKENILMQFVICKAIEFPREKVMNVQAAQHFLFQGSSSFRFFQEKKNQSPNTFLMSSHAADKKKTNENKAMACNVCSIQICSDDMTSNHPLIETRRPFFY